VNNTIFSDLQRWRLFRNRRASILVELDEKISPPVIDTCVVKTVLLIKLIL
jgi:hypothetical protein